MHHEPTTSPPHSKRSPRLAAVALAIAGVALLSGCFTMVDGKTYAVGLERNRANIVIHRSSTTLLHDIAQSHGTRRAREILLEAIPTKVRITTKQRIAMCAISPAACLTADQIGRVVLSRFRADVRSRSDFGEALSQAARANRCFAWTFIPSRNLTTKPNGTSGCRLGTLS